MIERHGRQGPPLSPRLPLKVVAFWFVGVIWCKCNAFLIFFAPCSFLAFAVFLCLGIGVVVFRCMCFRLVVSVVLACLLPQVSPRSKLWQVTLPFLLRFLMQRCSFLMFQKECKAVAPCGFVTRSYDEANSAQAEEASAAAQNADECSACCHKHSAMLGKPKLTISKHIKVIKISLGSLSSLLWHSKDCQLGIANWTFIRCFPRSMPLQWPVKRLEPLSALPLAIYNSETLWLLLLSEAFHCMICFNFDHTPFAYLATRDTSCS